MNARGSSPRDERALSFTPEVEEALAGLEGERDRLAATARLRERLPPAAVRAAADLREMRLRSARAYPRASPRYGTPLLVEVASREEVALARARRLAARFPEALVADLTAGMGIDAWALASAGVPVVACDRDRFHAACAARNLAGLAAVRGVVVADARHPAVAADLVLLDPDRRPGGRRERDPARWSPTLAECLGIAARHAGAYLKLAPGLDPSALERLAAPGTRLRLEWLSSGGELAELGVWTGVAAGEAPEDSPPRRAIVVDRDGGARSLDGPEVQVPPLSPEEAARVRALVDPDPAVVQAGLVGRLAHELGLRPLGPRCAYLGGDEARATPFGRAFRVLDSEPADRRRVRAMLERHDIGALTVKKRGHPDPAETLAKRLAGRGSRTGILVVARLERGHRAFLVEPAGPAA